MKLSWSHAVLNVRDIDGMLDFYTQVLSFRVTDRGFLGDDGSEIVFMSQDPEEHHQLAMVNTRKDEDTANSLNHLSFRVRSFAEVSALQATLKNRGTDTLPLSHGNTLSVYFNDPEGNGLEVFWDTPWHVAQPQGRVWDTSLDEEGALAWVRENFRDEPTFEPREDYFRRRAAGTG